MLKGSPCKLRAGPSGGRCAGTFPFRYYFSCVEEVRLTDSVMNLGMHREGT